MVRIFRQLLEINFQIHYLLLKNKNGIFWLHGGPNLDFGFGPRKLSGPCRESSIQTRTHQLVSEIMLAFTNCWKHDVSTMYLRGPAAQHLHNEVRRAQDTDGSDRTEYQKCPSMFFILCAYIEHVYIYLLYILYYVYSLYIYSKIVTNILIGFKIWCQVGVGVTLFFKLQNSREF